MSCKDCPSESSRPIKARGRCATHLRAKIRDDKLKARHRHILKNFNLTVADFGRIWAAQNMCCAVCKTGTRDPYSGMAIDHDHRCCPTVPTCGKCTRGIIHAVKCNYQLLGRQSDVPSFYYGVAEYLENPPAREVLDGR